MIFEKMTVQKNRGKGQKQHLPLGEGRKEQEFASNKASTWKNRGKIRPSQHELVKIKLGQTNLISCSDRVAGPVLGEDAGDVVCLHFREALQAVPPCPSPQHSFSWQFGCTQRGIIDGSLWGRRAVSSRSLSSSAGIQYFN